jgi:hypothetical protein
MKGRKKMTSTATAPRPPKKKSAAREIPAAYLSRSLPPGDR